MEKSSVQTAHEDNRSISRPEAIEVFIRSVHEIHDPDFGDFKRRATLYLHRLMDALGLSHAPTKELLATIMHRLNYEPELDIEQTRHQLLDLAEQLKKTN